MAASNGGSYRDLSRYPSSILMKDVYSGGATLLRSSFGPPLDVHKQQVGAWKDRIQFELRRKAFGRDFVH